MTIDNEQFLLDAYFGTGGFANKTMGGDASYLKKHVNESEEKYTRRKETCTYTNFAETIAGIYQGYLFKSPPRRAAANDIEQKFIENSDGAGTDLNNVIKSIQLMSFILGEVYIIVDRPSQKSDNAASDKLPYIGFRKKSHVTDEQFDAMGNLTSITFSEVAPDEKPLKRTYTTTGWQIDRDIYENGVVSGEYNFGRVPVVKLTSHRFLINVAAQSLKMFNLESEMDELLTSQAFSILYMFFTDIHAYNEAKAAGALTLGTENGIAVIGNNQPPGFISPDGINVNLYLSRINTVKEAIFRAACLEFLGSTQLSGEALQLLFNQLNARLSSIAKTTEVVEKQIFELVGLWMGEKSEIVVSYPSDFNIRSIPTEIQTAAEALALNVGSETFEKELKKRIAKIVLDDITAEKASDIDNEIDKAASYDESVDLNANINDNKTSHVIEDVNNG